MYERKGFVMRNWMAAAVAAMGLGLGVNAADAAVTYSVEFSGADLRDYSGDLIGTYDGSFSVVAPGAITSAGNFATASCTLSPNAALLYGCGPTQEFDPDGFGTGKNFISFQTYNLDLSGGGGAFLFFDAGSFLADGVYSLSNTVPCCFGSFAPTATLTVRGIGSNNPTGVPEPASLIILGAGLLGFARRRRA